MGSQTTEDKNAPCGPALEDVDILDARDLLILYEASVDGQVSVTSV